MKKLTLLLAALVFSVMSFAETATLSISKSVTAAGTLTDSESNDWTFSYVADAITGNAAYIHVGTGTKNATSITLETSAFNDVVITSVEVWGSSKANTNVTPKVYIGTTLIGEGTAYTTNNAADGGSKFTATNSDELQGKLKIEISRSTASKAAIYFNKAVVKYTTGGGQEVESISLDLTETSIVEGQTATINATVVPSTATVVWSTSASEIATVANGVVTAVSPGEATITASAGDKEATCTVTVTEDPETVWYERLTDVSELRNGDKVMISSFSGSALMSKTMGSSSSGAWLVDITTGLKYSADRTKCRETADAVYTVVKGTDYFELQAAEDQFLTIYGTPKVKLAASSDNSHLSIAVADGNYPYAAIKHATASYGQLKHNASATRFTTYNSGQAELAIYYMHDDNAGSLEYDPTELVFPAKRLKGEEARDTMAISFTLNNIDVFMAEIQNDEASAIDFYIDKEELSASGDIVIDYWALEAGEYSTTLDIMAEAANGQEWVFSIPVSVKILADEPLVAKTVAEVLSAYSQEIGPGGWAGSTTHTGTVEYMLGDVTVTGHAGNFLFVKDDTGSMTIYDNQNRTHAVGEYYANGTIISGLRGTMKVMSNAVEMIPSEALELTTTTGAAVAATTITEVPVLACPGTNIGKLVSVEAVTFSAAKTLGGYYDEVNFKLGGSTVTVNNYLMKNFTVNNTDQYDVTGYVWASGNSLHLIAEQIAITSHPHEPTHVTGIEMSVTSLNLTAGKTAQLSVTITPEDADNQSVTWSTSDETVATVNNGLVTALKGSETPVTITATTVDGGLTASCVITVAAAPGIRYQRVDDAATLAVGDTVIFVNETNQKANGALNGKYLTAVDASISDGVATTANAMEFVLGKSGDNWTLTSTTGTKLGKASNSGDVKTDGTLTHTISIDATTHDAYVTNTADNSDGYTIRYNAQSPRFSYYKSSSTVARAQLYRRIAGQGPLPVDVESVSLNADEVNLRVGDDAQLEVTVLPADATDKSVTWTSSDATVASVNGGAISALKEGTTTITVTSVANPTLTASCTINVLRGLDGETVTWNLLQTADSLKEGTRIFIASRRAGENYVMGLYDYDVAKSNIKGVSASFGEGRHTVTANTAYAYTVHITTNGIQLEDFDGDLLSTGGNRNLYVESPATQACNWQFSFADSVATLSSKYYTGVCVYNNFNNDMFNAYSSLDASNMAELYIYSENAPVFTPRELHPEIQVSETSLDWGKVEPDELGEWYDSRKIQITGIDIPGKINVSLSGSSTFTCSTTPISGTITSTLTVYWEAPALGTYSGTLTLSAAGVDDIIIPLTAEAVEQGEDPESQPTFTVSTHRVYLNPNFSGGEGSTEDMAIFYISASNLSKRLTCEWTGSIPTGGKGVMSIDGGGLYLTHGSDTEIARDDINNMEFTVYVNAYYNQKYESYLHFKSYKADSKTELAIDETVTVVVNMTTDPTPDPDPETGIINASYQPNGIRYNVMGQQVDAEYKGIVIIDGKKYLAR